MLRKLVFNDWVLVSFGLVLEDGGGRIVKWHVLVCGDFCCEVGSNAKKWADHRIETRISLYIIL